MNLNWDEVAEFTTLLKTLERVHRPYVDNLTGAEKRLLQGVSERFPRVERDAFLRHLPSQTNLLTDLADTNRYLLLRPIHKGVKLQPVVTFASDLRCTSIPVPKISVYVALGFVAQAKIRYLGYRFETPEGPPASSSATSNPRHSFFHAQPIRTFARGGTALNDPQSDLGLVPEDQPSFVLAANDFVSFGLSVFTALYGGHFLTQSLNEEMVSRKRLDQFRKLLFPDAKSSICRVISAVEKKKSKDRAKTSR